jgi:hypothetical protein
LDPDCWMCSSHMRPAQVDTNCKSIYRMRHCLDWETLSWFLDALFSPFSFPSYYPFDAEDFLCRMHIKYKVLFIAVGKKLKVCSIPWHKSCTNCGQRCRHSG